MDLNASINLYIQQDNPRALSRRASIHPLLLSLTALSHRDCRNQPVYSDRSGSSSALADTQHFNAIDKPPKGKSPWIHLSNQSARITRLEFFNKDAKTESCFSTDANPFNSYQLRFHWRRLVIPHAFGFGNDAAVTPGGPGLSDPPSVMWWTFQCCSLIL